MSLYRYRQQLKRQQAVCQLIGQWVFSAIAIALVIGPMIWHSIMVDRWLGLP